MASFKVETKQLRGEIIPTSGEHIFFDCNTGSAANRTDSFSVTVRGITYGVSAHFHKWANGEWGLGKQDDPPSTRFYHQLYISRRGGSAKSDVSHVARVTVAALLTAEVTAWLKDNRAALVEAGQDDAKREIEKREKKIGEFQGQIEQLQLEITSLRAK